MIKGGLFPKVDEIWRCDGLMLFAPRWETCNNLNLLSYVCDCVYIYIHIHIYMCIYIYMYVIYYVLLYIMCYYILVIIWCHLCSSYSDVHQGTMCTHVVEALACPSRLQMPLAKALTGHRLHFLSSDTVILAYLFHPSFHKDIRHKDLQNYIGCASALGGAVFRYFAVQLETIILQVWNKEWSLMT